MDLHGACRDGSLQDIKECLDSPDTDPNLIKDGWAAIHHAMLRNTPDIPEVLSLLAGRGANPSLTTDLGHSPLHLVLREGSRWAVDDAALALLRMGVDTDLSDMSQRTAYDYAAINGYTDVVAALMEDPEPGIQLLAEARSQYYGKQLITSVIHSDEERINLCLKRGADVNLINDLGAGAIHYVMTRCTLPSAQLTRMLLDAGTDPNLRTYEGDTALNLAIKSDEMRERGEQQDTVTVLLERGTDTSYKDLDDKNAFMLAEERGYADIVVLLNTVKMKTPTPIPEEPTPLPPPLARNPIPSPAPDESPPPSPESSVTIPLHRDISDLSEEDEDEDEDDDDYEEEDRLFQLVSTGTLNQLDNALDDPTIDLTAQNKAGEGVLHVAMKRSGDAKEQKEILHFLIDHGAPINAVNMAGCSALHVAAIRGLDEAAILLLDRGIDKNIKDKAGLTAAKLADKTKHPKVRDVINNHGKNPPKNPPKSETKPPEEPPKEKEKKDKNCVIS